MLRNIQVEARERVSDKKTCTREFEVVLVNESPICRQIWVEDVYLLSNGVVHQWFCPKTVTRAGVCCRIYVDRALNHAHFCMNDKNYYVKLVYAKVLIYFFSFGVIQLVCTHRGDYQAAQGA